MLFLRQSLFIDLKEITGLYPSRQTIEAFAKGKSTENSEKTKQDNKYHNTEKEIADSKTMYFLG